MQLHSPTPIRKKKKRYESIIVSMLNL